jgi:hypothetical protein
MLLLKKKSYYKRIYGNWVLILFAALTLSLLRMQSASAAAYVIGDAGKCVDGTQISTSAITSGNESSFCASHGGYDPRGLTHCKDGTGFIGGQGFNPTSFCASHGGYAPIAAPSPTTTPDPSSAPTTKEACLAASGTWEEATGTCIVNRSGTPVDLNAFGGTCGNTGKVEDNCIVTRIDQFASFLAAGVGIVVTIMIIVGGIQYSLAGDNPQAVQAAKTRIRNAIIAMVALLLSYSFIQWIIPGGIF